MSWMSQEAAITPALSLSAFGPLSVTWNDKEITRLGGGKLAALLVFLASEPGQHRREALADLFWPDLPAESARLNLRQTMFQLRSVLLEATGREFIVAGRDQVGLAAEPPFRTSTAEFAVPLPACTNLDSARCSACLPRLAALAELYRGAFLADLSLPDCPDFEDWLLLKRDSFHRRALDLLARLAECHERRGEYRAALPYALRYVELEPWSEAGQLRAMRLYVEDGQREAALAQYESCRRALLRELGVSPNTELQQFAEKIRAGGVAPPLVPPPALSEDRRQVTVLYCELNAENIDDPEETMAALRAPQARCTDILQRHAGHIVQAYCGGLIAYFGYPHALENSALYAVRAALALAAEATPRLSVRVGVHSGLIVTSADARAPDAIGTTSGIAIRLRELADVGEVVVSEETQRRVAGYFRFSTFGRRRLRGLPKAMEAFKVVGESGARHRLAAAGRLAPLTGRSLELTALLRAWARARQGEFRAVLLSGEAGIGKSRLSDALMRRLDNGSGIVREMRCFPETMQSPLQPVIALLAGLGDFQIGDDDAVRLTRLDNLLRMHTPDLAQRSLPLLGQLMGLATGTLPPHSVSTPEQLQDATRDVLTDLLYSLSTHYPVLLVAEDMHWADELTLDLLRRLTMHRAPVPVLLLMTARPDWRPDWRGLKTMVLAPLPDTDVGTLVGALRADLAPAHLARIVARAEGIPLFAEELAAMVGTGASDAEAELPASLHDLLMARLDKLGPARTLAQLAATLGREFDTSLLAPLSGLAPQALTEAVNRLCDSGLVLQMADDRLQFKHALVQEAAYQSQTRAARKTAHRRVAKALEALRGNDCRERPELPARHWSAAGEAARAVPLWLAAGKHAAQRFAHREAVAHYEAGIRLLAELPAGGERDRFEFALLAGLAQSEQVISGYGRGRSAELLTDAIALLGRGAGNGADLFHSVWGLWEGAGSRVDHGEAVLLARRLIEIAETEQASGFLLQGHYALGNSLFWTGELTESRLHLETALAMIVPGTLVPLRDCYGSIVVIGIKVYLSWVLWLQGDTERALMYSDEALALARRVGDAYGLAFALTFAAILRRWLGRLNETQHLAGEGRVVAATCESTVFEAAMIMTCGWAAVMQGDAKAIVLIEQAINTMRTAMSAVVVPLLAPFAEALLHLGDAATALPIVEEALRESEAKQDRHYLAELHRMKGLCLQATGNLRGAGASFRKAIAVAEAQGALVFAHRARQCLDRLAED